MKNSYIVSNLFILLAILLVSSCDNSVELKDGYTVYGNVTDLTSSKGISSVNIYVGYNVTDSTYFSGYFITSDTLGKFVFIGSPATAPSDEILRFEHPDYHTKDIILKNSVIKKDNSYRLNVSLQPK